MPLSPTPNWPGTGLDSLPNPSTSTFEDDDGFEIDLLLQKHNAILQAIEAKLGSTVTGTPGRGKAHIGSGTDAGIWDTIGRKNRLYNGSMRVAQRAMPTADNAYCLDRWRMLLGAASACTPSQELSDTPAGGSHRAVKLTVTATNNNKFGIYQPLEGIDIYDLRGQVVSLSFWAKVSNARIGDIRASVIYSLNTEDSGIGGSPISTWGNEGAGISAFSANYASCNTPANINPTTSWVRYYIENITVNAGANNLGVFIWSDDKTTTNGDYLLVTDVQLERGAVCTDVERLPVQQDLAVCQRYYSKSYAQATAPGGATQTGSIWLSTSDNTTTKAITAPVRFPVTMRAAPTVTLYDNAGNSGKITTMNAAVATTDNVTPNTGTNNTADSGFNMFHSGTIAGLQFHYTASAEL